MKMSFLLAPGGDPPTQPRAQQQEEQQEAAHQLVTIQGPHLGRPVPSTGVTMEIGINSLSLPTIC